MKHGHAYALYATYMYLLSLHLLKWIKRDYLKIDIHKRTCSYTNGWFVRATLQVLIVLSKISRYSVIEPSQGRLLLCFFQFLWSYFPHKSHAGTWNKPIGTYPVYCDQGKYY
jgi:S-adenosylmethionine:diacylglycerol 3-amino-3-carboxypropyl transferase